MQLSTLVNGAAALATKYGFDPAAYEDDMLHGLMDNGWSFAGAEEGIFEAMTPNGVKIGPMTPDEIFWCAEGFAAATRRRT